MTYDVIVIGGSYAGMAAALQLLRARRSVLVIDAGQRRNRFARSSHGFLGQDGADPAAIARNARAQLALYPTLRWIDGAAVAVTGLRDDFAVELADGQRHHGRRILLATGVTDVLPPVPGLAERWGTSVFHCPYCHGYELDQGAIGVIATGPLSLHQAELLTEWGRVTLLINGAIPPDAGLSETLTARGVVLEEAPVAGIEATAAVRLVDGRLLSFAGLFTATRVVPASPLPAQLGCALEEGPMGQTLRVDASKQTTVPGVYACGDVAHLPHSVSLAVGDGAMTGLHLHRALVWPEGVA